MQTNNFGMNQGMNMGMNQGMNMGMNQEMNNLGGMPMNSLSMSPVGLNLGALGMMNPGTQNGIITNNTFTFMGSLISFEGRLATLTDSQLNNVVDARIVIQGNLIKQQNGCCIGAIVITGSILLLPLFCLCFPPMQRYISSLHDIPDNTYEAMRKIFRAPNLKNVTLFVKDCNFSAQKAQILYSHLSSSRLSGFSFINTAPDLNFANNNFSDFDTYMKPIKSLPFSSNIFWSDCIVL